MQQLEHSRWVDLLEEEDLAFIKRFILSSGSLKDLAAAYSVTYPTLRLLARPPDRQDHRPRQSKNRGRARTAAPSFVRRRQTRHLHLQTTPPQLRKTERPSMKSLLLWPAAFFILTLAAHGQQVLVEYHWKDLARDGLPGSGTPLTVDGREVLKLENTNDAPLQVSLLTIKDPKLSPATRVYGLTGELRCEVVQGAGYLEMWSYFPPEKPGLPEVGCFSRTLGETGPMRKISGTSDWREVHAALRPHGCSPIPPRVFNSICSCRGGAWFTSPASGSWNFPMRTLCREQSFARCLVVRPHGRLGGWVGRGADRLSAWQPGCVAGLSGKGARIRDRVASNLDQSGHFARSCRLVGGGPASTIRGLVPARAGRGAAALLCARFVCREFNRKYEEMEPRRMASLDAPGAASRINAVFNHGWTRSVNPVQNAHKMAKKHCKNKDKLVTTRQNCSLLFVPGTDSFTESRTTGKNSRYAE